MYTYNDLLSDLTVFRGKGARTGEIGRTLTGVPIPYVEIGDGTGPRVLIQAAIHAREHITAKLVSDMIYYTLEVYGPNLRGRVYFIPMANIDGVTLCQFGLDAVTDPARREFLSAVNGRSGDFTLWKANAAAVDLNCNFPAKWGAGVQNVFSPAPSDYAGPYPASEFETRALMDFTLLVRPALTLSYHCRGREIYWRFFQSGARLTRDRLIAEAFSRETGYRLVDDDRGSAGGYKDWCAETLRIPAYTFEIIPERYPFPVDYSVLRGEFPRNRDIPVSAITLANRYAPLVF